MLETAVARTLLLLAVCWLTLAPPAPAQPADNGPQQAPSAGENESSETPRETAPAAVSSNPAADNIVTGTGALGRLLGFADGSGVRLGGAWIGDANWLATGGLDSGQWALNSLTLVDLFLDAEKLWGIKGGSFGIDFLQYSGQPGNQQAGTVQGYNGLEATPPLVRQELYELWWRQSLFDDRLVVRIGKTVPTFDFNNVSRPAPTADISGSIPAVTGLIYTPVFKNSTLLGKMPGYYNSATGITTTLAPTKNLYFSYGVFDGNQALGAQTGLRGPQFNGYYFHIWEAGVHYRLGPQAKPGSFSCGMWEQTGTLTTVNGARVDGANGFYLFGSQRLWFRRPGQDNSGVSGFYQFGANNAATSLVRQYLGLGLTGFGLVPQRPKDSMGCGLAWGWLNTDANAGAFFFPHVASPATSLRTNEIIAQGYYQMHLRAGAYVQPVLTYVPNPGMRPGIPAAWAVTLRLMLLF